MGPDQETGQLLKLSQLLLLTNHSFPPLLTRVENGLFEKISTNQGFRISSSNLARIFKQATREALEKQILLRQYQLI